MILVTLRHTKTRRLKGLLLVLTVQYYLTGCASSVDSKIEKMISYRVNGELNKRFEAFLHDRNPAVRARLAYELSLCEDTSGVSALRKLFNDSSPLVRNISAYALGRFETAEARKSLLERIEKEADPDVLEEIFLSIGKNGTEEDLRSLVLKNKVRGKFLMLALEGFLERGIYTEGRINFLLEKLANGNLREREMAARILVFASDSVRVDLSKKVIDGLFSSPGNKLPFYAVLLAAKYGKVDKTLLKSVVDSPDPRIKIKMLSSLKGFRTYKSFWKSCLRDTNVSVRSAAIEYLYKNCSDVDRETQAFIEKQGYSSRERSIVAKAVEFVFARGDIIDLKKKIDEVPFRNFKNNAVRGLYYNPSPDRVKLLKSFLNDKEPSVKRSAYKYLMKYLVEEYKSNSADGRALVEYILWGLDSADPVIAFLALDAARKSGVYYDDFDPAVINGAMQYVKMSNKAFFVGLAGIMEYMDSDALKGIKREVDRCGIDKVRDLLYSRLGLDGKEHGSYGVKYKWLKRHDFNPLVRVNTTEGSFMVKCDGFFAPVTSLRFMELARKHFYDGGRIWRDYAQGMVFFGDTTGTEFLYPEGISLVEYSPLEFSEWTVGVLNAEGQIQGASFFLVTVPSYDLNGRYTRLGKVISGKNVILALDEFDRILSIELVR